MAVTNYQRTSFTLKDRRMSVLTICFNFSEIHDCVGKASSTGANKDRAIANSHQLSSLFDPVSVNL